jgi:metal-responsive CopG/Arc/MetJ family transcriptional regulator
MAISNPKKTRRPASTSSRKRVVIDFPHDLFRQTERAASELAVNRSNFIRAAVERYIGEMGRKRLEEELIEGYTANAEFSRRINEEFSHVDAAVS